MRSYFLNRLPLPFTIYKYDKSGSLVGVFSTSRIIAASTRVTPEEHNRDHLYKKMESFIIISSHDDPANQAKLDDYNTKIKQFVSDMGYKLDDLVDHNKTYTLILIETDSSKASCPSFKRAHEGNVNAVEHAIMSDSSNSYAVRQIVVGGPGFKFGSC